MEAETKPVIVRMAESIVNAATEILTELEAAGIDNQTIKHHAEVIKARAEIEIRKRDKNYVVVFECAIDGNKTTRYLSANGNFDTDKVSKAVMFSRGQVSNELAYLRRYNQYAIDDNMPHHAWPKELKHAKNIAIVSRKVKGVKHA